MRRSVVAAVAAVAAMTLSGCGFHGLYGVSLPGGTDLGSHPYTIRACFSDVLDLVPQSSVKVNDVPVGRVENVKLASAKNGSCGNAASANWTALVTMQVRGDVHLPLNARAEIQQTSLLGEKYVALEQPMSAPSTKPLVNNDVIQLTNTGSAPEVEEVLGSLSLLLNGGGLNQLHTITTELNKALNGNEPAIRDLLSQLNNFVGQLDLQKSDILTALDSLDRLSTTLAQQNQTIADTLDTLPKALAVLREDRSKLTTLLTSLSHLGSVASNVIVATQTSLTSALRDLSPALEQLAAAGSNLPHALRIAGTFPFPLGTALQGIRGDYANLHLFLDLTLTNELCGINKALCLTSGAGGGLLNGLTKSSQPIGSTTTADAKTSAVNNPTLLGLGG